MSLAPGDRTIPLVLFLLVWFSAAWFGSWEHNANNATRMFAAISLVEDGDATIDEFAHLTIDKARFGGHAYLDKAPGMTLMALPAVALANAVTGQRSAQVAKVQDDAAYTRFLRLRTRLAAASGPALLTAFAAVLLYDLALGLTGSAAAALFASLGYALGTPAWGWSTTLFGHAAVAALFVIATWAVWRGTATARSRPGLAFLAGAALGWAVVVEYHAVLAGGAIGAWALWRAWPRPDRWRLIGWAAAGGLVAGLPLLGYNLVAYGTPFRLGYQDVVGWEGMDRGLFGLTVPDPLVLVSLLVGDRRGLVWVAPVLAMAAFGLARLVREPRHRDLGIMAAAVVAIVLLVNAAYVYWDGGNSTGPRLAMPMVGLLALGLAPFWTSLADRLHRIAAVALLALSITLNTAIAAAEIAVPPDFRMAIWTGVIRHRFLPGDLRTVPSEWWGWSTWAGFGLWAAVAVPVLVWLAFLALSRERERVLAKPPTPPRPSSPPPHAP